MARTEQRQIDWSTAEMHEGTLRVQLTGDASKPWSEDFEGVLALLAHGAGEWGQIGLAKRRRAIEVTEVTPGSEDDLRHLLESAVLQVNSDLRPDSAGSNDTTDDDDDDPDGSEQGDEDGEATSEADSHKQLDREMVRTFRGFGELADADSSAR